MCIGRQAYGTAFGETRGSADYTEGASQTLAVNGLSYVGKDTLYSGASGIPFSAYIFMGPVFYQKLKHMVMDKMHARARGPRAQPICSSLANQQKGDLVMEGCGLVKWSVTVSYRMVQQA